MNLVTFFGIVCVVSGIALAVILVIADKGISDREYEDELSRKYDDKLMMRQFKRTNKHAK